MSILNFNALSPCIYPPFDKWLELNDSLDPGRPQHVSQIYQPQPLPGHPLVNFRHRQEVNNLLNRELLTPKLDSLYKYPWLVGTQNGSHISPLHFQNVKGREVVITEDPELHLVWYYDRTYVKPIPAYLFSYEFWREYLCSDGSRSHIHNTALGFMRSWTFLIQSESDFNIASERKLIRVPGFSGSYEDYTKLLRFLQIFTGFEDKAVSRRYHYGELRLIRLNLWTRLAFRSLHHQKVYGQYGAYFASKISPLVFVITIVAVSLAALQVLLAHESLDSAT